MEHVKKELHDGLKHHLKQLEENHSTIIARRQSIVSLKLANKRHMEAISEIKFYLEQLEKTEKAAT